ncbi:sericin-2-like [Diachasma alloeum]|uniref:sericin-2-like n=1 Tax=Diachasma alloeum TaxID=454923 RepID=UPI0007381183|nr:sericin-2-like [Diachasma alloeum]
MSIDVCLSDESSDENWKTDSNNSNTISKPSGFTSSNGQNATNDSLAGHTSGTPRSTSSSPITPNSYQQRQSAPHGQNATNVSLAGHISGTSRSTSSSPIIPNFYQQRQSAPHGQNSTNDSLAGHTSGKSRSTSSSPITPNFYQQRQSAPHGLNATNDNLSGYTSGTSGSTSSSPITPNSYQQRQSAPHEPSTIDESRETSTRDCGNTFSMYSQNPMPTMPDPFDIRYQQYQSWTDNNNCYPLRHEGYEYQDPTSYLQL